VSLFSSHIKRTAPYPIKQVRVCSSDQKRPGEVMCVPARCHMQCRFKSIPEADVHIFSRPGLQQSLYNFIVLAVCSSAQQRWSTAAPPSCTTIGTGIHQPCKEIHVTLGCRMLKRRSKPFPPLVRGGLLSDEFENLNLEPIKSTTLFTVGSCHCCHSSLSLCPERSEPRDLAYSPCSLVGRRCPRERECVVRERCRLLQQLGTYCCKSGGRRWSCAAFDT
ncbi:unnamed protein product, partial [Ectocarpus sp. 12 AP-2014]